jgi:hypothetical protein
LLVTGLPELLAVFAGLGEFAVAFGKDEGIVAEEPIVGGVRPTATRRKLRLFAAACFRRLGSLLPDARQQQAVELLENMPDDVEIRRSIVVGVRQALPPSTNSYARQGGS